MIMGERVSPEKCLLEDKPSFWNGPFSGDMLIFVR